MISVGSAVRLMVQLADRPQKNRGIVFLSSSISGRDLFFSYSQFVQ
jgi:hypothetical protein